MNVFNGVSQRTNFPFSLIIDFCNESKVKTERESKASKEKDPMSEMSTTMVMALGIDGAVECSPGCFGSLLLEAKQNNPHGWWVSSNFQKMA